MIIVSDIGDKSLDTKTRYMIKYVNKAVTCLLRRDPD